MSDSERIAEQHGITTNHQQMPNGELRFRLIGPDGSAYIRTVAGPKGGWQNSHYHHQLRETYIVEKGWMVMAELDDDGALSFHKLNAGDIRTSPVKRAHNVFLPAGAVIHTVKHCVQEKQDDWHPFPSLDELTKGLSEDELCALVGGDAP